MKEITERVIGAAIEVHKTVGLLIAFNVPVLKNGIKRVVLNYKDSSATSASLR